MPTPPSRLIGPHDCMASNLFPGFEACVAVAADGAVWLLERSGGTASWSSLGTP